MKTLITASIVLMLFAVTVKAQHMHHTEGDQKKQKNDMVKMMGDPVFEQSAEGIKVQVWLITQEEHKKKMSEHQKEMKHGDMKMDHNKEDMNHGDMKMDHDMKHSGHDHAKMMEGTHHIMVVVTDESAMKEVENTTVGIESFSPSKKVEKTELASMMNHFGGGLTLEEKGKYTFTLVVKVGEKIVKLPMAYNLQ
ncbi:MAG: hypothetical protein AB1600_03030 [Bacteroidota bacterium]